jgi:hypothetical protein
MGGKSKTSQSTSQKTSPWEPAQPALEGLLGQIGSQIGSAGITPTETNALDSMSGFASGGNQFAPQVNRLAGDLLGGGQDRTGMVNDAYSQYRTMLEPTARGDFVNPESNPQLQSYLSTIQNDIAGRVNSQFASAGRDFSGAHAGALGRGIASGTAPVLYDAYSQARGQQLGAQDKLFGAGGATAGLLSGLDQTAFGNRQAGIGASEAANSANMWGPQMQLAIEAQRRGIPMDQLAQLTKMTAGIGALGGQVSGTTTGEKSDGFSPASLLPLALAFL